MFKWLQNAAYEDLSNKMISLNAKIAVLEGEIAKTNQMLTSLRGLVNRKLGNEPENKQESTADPYKGVLSYA